MTTETIQRDKRIGLAWRKAVHWIASAPTFSWLFFAGLIMAITFYVGFTGRYGLLSLSNIPNASFSKLNQLSASSAILYLVSFAVLFACYWVASRYVIRQQKRIYWIVVALFAVIFNILMLAMYPMDAADIYDYILRGRMTTRYGLNPFINEPIEVYQDQFFYYTAFRYAPSQYGPFWETVAGITSRLAGDDMVLNTIAFKLVESASCLLTGLFIFLTLRCVAPKRSLLGFYLYTWNPLVLFMIVGRGHNDGLMVMFLTMGVYCLLRRWYVASTCSALLGALVKFVPLLLIPIIAIVAFRELRGWQRLRCALLSFTLGGLLFVLALAPYWQGPESIRSLGLFQRADYFTSSAPTLVREAIAPLLDNMPGEYSEPPETNLETPITNLVLKYVTFCLLGTFYGYQMAVLWLKPRRDDPIFEVRLLVRVLLFYLLVTCTWFQPWYVIWLIPLASLLDNTFTRRLVFLFSYTVTWATILYSYITLRFTGEFFPLPWRDLVPVSVILGIVWAYALIYWGTLGIRMRLRTPSTAALGAQLRRAREAAHVTVPELADALNWHSDDIAGYEQGNVALPIHRLEALSAYFQIPLTNFVENSAINHSPIKLPANLVNTLPDPSRTLLSE